MQLKVDEDLCVGCGLCEENLPSLIEMGRHFAQLKQTRVRGSHMSLVIETIKDCPAGALSLRED